MNKYNVPVFFTVEAESAGAARAAVLSLVEGHFDYAQEDGFDPINIGNLDDIEQRTIEPVTDEERSNGPRNDDDDDDDACPCGSGLEGEAEYDARGIYLCRCCDKCREEKLKTYRPEVLSDPGYECDEPIEPEDY